MSKDAYEHCWNWPGSPWKTRASWMNWLRGSIRKVWSRHPVKIAKLSSSRYKITNPNEASAKRFPTVWGADCACCGGTFPLSGGKKEGKQKVTMQVDHINAAGTFSDVRDFQGFFERMFCVGIDDLRLVCTDCNKTLALGDRFGWDYDRAKLERKAIEIVKAKTEKSWLLERGIIPASAQANRRKQVVEKLLEERNGLEKTSGRT